MPARKELLLHTRFQHADDLLQPFFIRELRGHQDLPDHLKRKAEPVLKDLCVKLKPCMKIVDILSVIVGRDPRTYPARVFVDLVKQLVVRVILGAHHA